MKKVLLVSILLLVSSFALATSTTIVITSNDTQVQAISRLDSANKATGMAKLRNYFEALMLGAQNGSLTVKVGTNGTRTYRFGR